MSGGADRQLRGKHAQRRGRHRHNARRQRQRHVHRRQQRRHRDRGRERGTDVVQASVSYTLGANVENIVLTGTAAINATGNASNNTLTGNAGANRLNGGGGADTMIGGAGNDTYVVDGTTDVVTEAASAGTDTVESSITYTLGANVENLTLTGTAAINATGNALANVLTGNSGANQLNGGTGADTMAGGAGNDIYVVITWPTW